MTPSEQLQCIKFSYYLQNIYTRKQTEDFATARPIHVIQTTRPLSRVSVSYSLHKLLLDSTSDCCSHVPVRLPLRLAGLHTQAS